MRNETTVALAVTVMVAALVMLIAAAAAGAAVKPKPWMWTAGQAAAKVDAGTDDMWRAQGPASCRGAGKQVARRYVAFRCQVTVRVSAIPLETRRQPVFVKVRQKGQGGACFSLTSLASVRAACLRASSVRGGTPDEAAGQVQIATTRRFNPESGIPWQSFTRLDCLGADGFYECWFESAVSGTATVAFARQPIVRFVALTCTGAFAGRPECTVFAPRHAPRHES